MSPLQKENSPPPPQILHPKTTRPFGRYTDFPMTTNKMGSKLTHRTPSTLTPAFLQAVPVQKCAALEHKEVIQTSSAEGNAEMLGRVGLLLFIHLKGKPHILQFCIYFCLLLPTQKTKLPSINLSDPVDYLNSNVGWLVVRVYGCGFFFLSCGSHATHTKDVFGCVVFRMSTSHALFQINLTHLIKRNEPCLPALTWRRC